MNRSILSGPPPAAAHLNIPPLDFGAGIMARRSMIFFDPERTAPPNSPALTGDETTFRKTVLDGVEGQDKKLSTLVTDHTELKKKAEEAFKDLGEQKALTVEQAKKILSLERSLVCASRNMDPNEDGMQFFKRAYPEECKEVGQAILDIKKSFNLRKKTEGTDTQPALVPTQFSDSVYSRVVNYGAFRALDTHPMGAQTEEMIVETSEPVAVFVPENGVIPQSTLGLGPVGMTAKKIGLLLGVSQELLQDSIIDLGAYVVNKFARAVAKRADFAAYMSTGANDIYSGGFTGVFNAGTAVVAAAGHTTIGAMTLDDILKLISSVPQAVIENGPKWFINPFLLPQFLGIKDGNGRPLFLNALEAPAYGAIGTLLGFPVVPVSVAPSTNAASSQIAAFGDPAA